MDTFRKSCIYQIYPISFQDTNDDGLGDLNGITSRLPYLKQLGVDTLWVTPFFLSPKKDNGYDIEDYRSVDPAFGTMEDLETLITQANKHEIKLMLDMVFNHTSIAHEWFQKAIVGDSYYQDFYIFKKGKENGAPPTNWISKFGGSAWEYVPALDQYYLHLFDKTQADLNWKNPNVRKELYQIIDYWKQKGIKGFRFDVINLISKPEHYQDDTIGDGRRFYTDGAQMHEYLKEMNRECKFAEDQIVTVGEMSSTALEHCVAYSNPNEQELSMCFGFHHLKIDYKNQQKWELQQPDFQKLKELLHGWQIGMQQGNGWNSLFWCNHDQPRIVSRLGDDQNYRIESAKMLATVIHLMRGTPYIYQGEEIGMTNAYFTDIEQYRDVESLNYDRILRQEGKSEQEITQILQARSRDNSRTPMQWDDSPYAGFSQTEPWIEVNPNYKTINVKQSEQDATSILQYYQTLIRLRKELDVISDGTYEPILEEHTSVFAYKRIYHGEQLIVIANFYGKETTVCFEQEQFESYHPILTNYEKRPLTQTMHLRPFESVVYLQKTEANETVME